MAANEFFSIIQSAGTGAAFMAVLFVFLVGLWTVFSVIWSGTRNASDKHYESVLKLCLDASRTAASIAANPTSAKHAEHIERFEELFWGELVVVEDRALEEAMVNFRSRAVLGPHSENAHKPHLQHPFKAEMARDDDPELRQGALAIAMACHDLVRRSPLGQLREWIRPPRKLRQQGVLELGK